MRGEVGSGSENYPSFTPLDVFVFFASRPEQTAA